MDTPMETKRFQRRVEDFVCAHCSRSIVGSGFTNHCPHCLYSQHVDIHPGDRAAACGGLMEPVHVEPFGQDQKILHHCLVCGHEQRNKIVPEDDFEAVLKLQEAANRKKFYLGK